MCVSRRRCVGQIASASFCAFFFLLSFLLPVERGWAGWSCRTGSSGRHLEGGVRGERQGEVSIRSAGGGVYVAEVQSPAVSTSLVWLTMNLSGETQKSLVACEGEQRESKLHPISHHAAAQNRVSHFWAVIDGHGEKKEENKNCFFFFPFCY